MTLAPRHVFLHTGWRSAGTWIWSRFRVLPEVRAFYEPFHPALAGKLDAIAAIKPEAWASGHPILEEAYFHEYLPIVRAWGGVRGYRPAFEVDRFDGMSVLGQWRQRSYLQGLLKAAEASGKVAVLKFCRSMGRLPWLQRAFPDAAHAVVVRNPASQWSSYWSQWKRHQNPWFLAAPCRVLGWNLEVPRVGRALRALGCEPEPLLRLAQLREEEVARQVLNLAPEALYRAHLAHWTLSLLSLNSEIDGVLDSDQLTHSRAHAQECAALLARSTGIHLDFSDAQITESGKYLCFKAVHREPDELAALTPIRLEAIHGAALQFAQQELGPGRGMALDIIRAKLHHADEQVQTGGIAHLENAVHGDF